MPGSAVAHKGGKVGKYPCLGVQTSRSTPAATATQLTPLCPRCVPTEPNVQRGWVCSGAGQLCRAGPTLQSLLAARNSWDLPQEPVFVLALGLSIRVRIVLSYKWRKRLK